MASEDFDDGVTSRDFVEGEFDVENDSELLTLVGNGGALFSMPWPDRDDMPSDPAMWSGFLFMDRAAVALSAVSGIPSAQLAPGLVREMRDLILEMSARLDADASFATDEMADRIRAMATYMRDPMEAEAPDVLPASGPGLGGR